MHLKARGMTYADVARALGISEATVKRIFAAKNCTVERLDSLCELVQVDLAEGKPPDQSADAATGRRADVGSGLAAGGGVRAAAAAGRGHRRDLQADRRSVPSVPVAPGTHRHPGAPREEPYPASYFPHLLLDPGRPDHALRALADGRLLRSFLRRE